VYFTSVILSPVELYREDRCGEERRRWSHVTVTGIDRGDLRGVFHV
jgi:hypothetical protein